MRLSRRLIDDDGSASLEFVTAGMIMLLPLVYLVLTMASIQGGALAVEGASRQAVRVFVQAGTEQEAQHRATRAIAFALADYGLDADDAEVSVQCSPKPSACLTRLGTVTVTVRTRVAMPLVPPILSLDVPLSVPLTSTATERVSRFWGAQ
jgi:hypothetical protein